jgi:hypothetical protein
MAGYSATPLVKKLGIAEGCRLFLSGAPDHYLELLGGRLPDGAALVPRLDTRTDVAHVFDTDRARLAKTLRAALPRLKPGGVIWVSWPKKASKVPTDITEDTIREVALPLGLVDVKVCAVDEVWSGLKLVIRRQLRAKSHSGSARRPA